MGTRVKAPTVNTRIRQLKKQKKVTGGKSVALPPGITVKRKKTKRKKAKRKDKMTVRDPLLEMTDPSPLRF